MSTPDQPRESHEGTDDGLYKEIVSNIAEGIVLHGSDGRILTSNRAAEQILGLTTAQLEGRDSLDARWHCIREDGAQFPGEEHPAMVALRTGESQRDVVMGVQKPSGELTWIRVTAHPISEGETPRPNAVIVSFVDVTDLKRAETHLRQQSERVDHALRSARTGTWEWNMISDRIRFSDAMQSILQVPSFKPAEVDTASLIAIVHEADRERVAASIEGLRRAPVGEDRYDIVHRIVRGDGEVRWVSVFGRINRDPESGRPKQVVGIVTDITERKSMQDQSFRTQRLEALGRLAGGIAHDFNNLLTAAMGAVALAERNVDSPDRVRSSLEVIRASSERAARLTQQLLTFARKQVFDVETIDVGQLIGEMRGLLDCMVSANVAIELELPDEPLFVQAGRAQLEQIAINLTVNAAEAMPQGGRLTIAIEEDGESLSIGFADTGCGVPPDALDKLFEPFYTTKETGTGLGLATCYGIATQLGGTLSVESALGEGTTFTVTLPRAAAPPRTATYSPRSLEGSARVLLVDDDFMVGAVVARTLEERGFEVLRAEGGEQALALLDSPSTSIDVLITDVVMPRMTGIELARRARTSLPELPILLVSGYSEPDLMDARSPEAIPRGVGFLAKPFQPDALIAKVRELLDERVDEAQGPSRSPSADT